MILTEEEKQIINNIENGNIRKFADYMPYAFAHFEPLKNIDYNHTKEYVTEKRRYWFTVDNSFLGLKNETKLAALQNEVSSFIALIKTLEEHKLIFTLTVESPIFPAILFFSEHKNMYIFKHIPLNTIIFEFKNLNIFPTPQLTSFIENNYQTDIEYFNYVESKDRKKSHNLTIYIAAFSILVSAILNYFLYNNNREVHINNSEPTQIEIKSIDTNLIKYLKNTDTTKCESF